MENIGKDIEKLIADYLSGKITPDDKEKLILWVQDSPDNLRQYQQSKNIWQVSHPVFNPDDIHTDEAYGKITNTLFKRNWYKTTLIYWQRAAAILLLPLILLSAYLFTNSLNESTDISYHEIFAPYGTHSKVNLPDGSNVWLNAGSSLKYPTSFIPGKRDVYLSGEGYFEVQSDVDNPFFVHMEKMKLRATGTAFNIENYKNDSLIAVTLVEGKVDITIGNAKTFDLFPGERMGFNIHTAQCEIIKTEPYKWYAWKDGAMVFRDDPLSYVFKRIGKTFNVDIVVKDTAIASHPYRATFQDESLDEILRLLKLSAPIVYSKSDREKTPQGQYKKQSIEVSSSKKQK